MQAVGFEQCWQLMSRSSVNEKDAVPLLQCCFSSPRLVVVVASLGDERAKNFAEMIGFGEIGWSGREPVRNLWCSTMSDSSCKRTFVGEEVLYVVVYRTRTIIKDVSKQLVVKYTDSDCKAEE